MPTIRRIYWYLALTVGLAVTFAGLSQLGSIGLELLRQWGRAGIHLPPDELSRAIAFTLVGLAIWVGHTVAIVRAVGRDDRGARVERGSPIRATVLTATIVTLLAAVAVSAYQLVDEWVGTAFGERFLTWERLNVAAQTALIIVALALAIPSIAWRIADHRRAPEQLADDLATRVGVYGLLAGATLLSLVGIADLLGASIRGIAGIDWETLRGAMASAVAMLAIGAPAVLVLGWAAGRLAHAEDPIGVAHRRSRVRAAGWQAVVLGGAVALGLGLAQTIGAAAAWIAGTPGVPELGLRLLDVTGPVLVAVPFAIAALLSARRARGEGRVADGAPGARTALRVSSLTVAMTGVVLLADGAIRLIVIILSPILPASTVLLGGGAGDPDLGPAIGMLLAGLVLWAPAWALLATLRSIDPVGEAAAMTRRGALVLTGLGALVVSVVSGAFLLDRLLRDALGGRIPADGAGVTSFAVLAVALAVLLFHAVELWRDLRLLRGIPVTGDAVDAAIAEELDLVLPGGTDVDALNERIRALLPPGTTLRVRRHAHG